MELWHFRKSKKMETTLKHQTNKKFVSGLKSKTRFCKKKVNNFICSGIKIDQLNLLFSKNTHTIDFRRINKIPEIFWKSLVGNFVFSKVSSFNGDFYKNCQTIIGENIYKFLVGSEFLSRTTNHGFLQNRNFLTSWKLRSWK